MAALADATVVQRLMQETTSWIGRSNGRDDECQTPYVRASTHDWTRLKPEYMTGYSGGATGHNGWSLMYDWARDWTRVEPGHTTGHTGGATGHNGWCLDIRLDTRLDTGGAWTHD